MYKNKIGLIENSYMIVIFFFSGMVRVGDLSKGLLLASDRTVNLILLCKHTPSLTLLRDIQKLIVEKLAEVVPDNKYQLHSFEEQAGFCIAAMPDSEDCKTSSIEDPENEPPYAVNVTLTSTSLRQPKGKDKRNLYHIG